jgi:hypothetical protein
LAGRVDFRDDRDVSADEGDTGVDNAAADIADRASCNRLAVGIEDRAVGGSCGVSDVGGPLRLRLQEAPDCRQTECTDYGGA